MTTGSEYPLLEVRGLRKTYKVHGRDAKKRTAPAVNDVSFDLHAGETLALVGESGAGKSTTGYLTLRLQEPDAGTIVFEGKDIRTLPRRELRSWRRRAQIVFQDPYGSFDPRMTIGASLVEPLVIHDGLKRSKRQDTAVEILERFGMNDSVLERYPYEFSGGQLQRLAIARAIACEPALLVCDEPVAALDMSIQAQILNLLKDLQRETGIAMLFISHDLSLVRTLADRIAVMYNGRIVEIGPTKQVYECPAHPYTQALLSAVPVPNPRIQRRRKAIPIGPKVTAPVGVGCPFQPRCPQAMDICAQVNPELRGFTNGVLASCHLDPVPSAVTEQTVPL